MPWMNDTILCISPNGRYGCRTGSHYEKTKDESVPYGMHIIDFEEEVNHERYLITFCNFHPIYFCWLDDEHICAVFRQDWDDAINNTPETIRPQRALYKVVLTEKCFKPEKIIYWKEIERGFALRYGFQISHGFLNINEQEYLVFIDTNTTIADATRVEEPESSSESEEKESDECIWIRFIPKKFGNFEEIEEQKIDYSQALDCSGIEIDPNLGGYLNEIVAYKHTLYFKLRRNEFLIMDMQKYFTLKSKEMAQPPPSEYCCGIVIPEILPNPWSFYFQNGFVYLKEMDENHEKEYLRIWNLENNTVSGLLVIDDPLVIVSSMSPSQSKCPHPCGSFLQFDALSFVVQWPENRNEEHRCFPRKIFTYKFGSLKPVRTKVELLKQLAIDQILLSSVQNNDKMPRCLRKGRVLLKLDTSRKSVKTAAEKKSISSCNFEDVLYL